MEDQNQTVSAFLEKLKQLDLAEAMAGANWFPGVNSNVILQSLNHPAGSDNA